MTTNIKKNLIANGSMNIAQRSVGPEVISDGQYSTVDRWKFYLTSNGTFTSEQKDDSPIEGTKSLKMTVKKPSNKTDQHNRLLVQYLLDDGEISKLNFGSPNAATITLSFFAKASHTGNFSLNIAKPENNRLEWTQKYRINKKNVWQRFEFTIQPNSYLKDKGGAVGLGFGVGLLVTFALGFTKKTYSAWDHHNPKLGEWIEGTNLWCFEDQIDWTAKAGATWQVAAVKLEVGQKATNFEVVSEAEELAECQRYYWPANAAATDNQQLLDQTNRQRFKISLWDKVRLGAVSLRSISSRDYWAAVGAIAEVNISKQYRTSFLGILWIIIPPVTMMAIYAVIIPLITGMDPQKFAIYLLSTLPIWQYIVLCITTPASSLISSNDLLKRCSVSPTIFPVADLIKNTYTSVIALLGMIAFCVALGLTVPTTAFLLPIYLIPVGVSMFALGIGIAFVTPFFQDLKEAIAVAANILIWCSAVLYPIDLLPAFAQELMLLNPLYILMEPSINLIANNEIPSFLVSIKLLAVTASSLLVGFLLYCVGHRNFIYYL